ncbi:putative ribonuclease H-like domain-containing protein [Tanacetum coccineum]
MVPRTVLSRSGLISVNISNRPANTVTKPRTAVNTVKGTRVNTTRPKAVLSAVKGNKGNAVKASACNPQQDLKDKGLIASGCSRHMIGNRSYLTDYEEINGEFVAFGVFTQMCDKNNSVLFTDTECVVLSLNFKLTDESHVLLKVSRKDNMYSVDLKNVFLKAVLTCIENLIDLKVKVIRCDNGTEFKNRVMNQFCEMKGIKREFSVAGTSQQNGVAKRKNRTLIEAARTVLADSKLQTTFWAEVVNTACYVQIGWNQSNGKVGTKACDYAGKARVETVPGKDYILLPLWTQDLPFSSSLKDSPDAGFKPSGEKENKDAKDPGNKGGNLRADINNLDTYFQVSHVPTTRIHKDHPLNQVIGDLQSATQTRQMTKNSEEYGQLLQFKLQKLDLVELPKETRAIGPNGSSKTKRMKKMDVKSAFLYGKIEEEVYKSPLYGLHQAPKAWYEILSAYLLDNGFQRGKIDKTLFIKRDQGLQVKQKEDVIFLSQDKYVTEILKKFSFSDVKTTSTPMETHKLLLKDADGEDVDEHLYRSMIGSLMYLTSSRPDIMFAVCACARFQVNPKISHLHAVKRIFRYLKGQPKLGLWYPKDSPFDLVAFTNSDYTGASLYRKPITGGCQFLGYRLISWQCKKQIVVANSTTKVEYISASNYCGQVLWIQNQLLDYGYKFMHTKIYIDNESTICIVKNLVFHSKTKHIEIRHHFIMDSNRKKLIQMIKIHTDQNVANLLTKAFDRIIYKGWLQWNAKDTKDGIGVKTGNSRVNAVGHYLVLLGKKNVDLAEILDFLNDNPIRFLQLFLNKQIENLSEVNVVYGTPSHTKNIFTNMRRQGKDFSRTVTPLFSSMLAQQADMGKGPGQPTNPQHTSTSVQPSNEEPITVPSLSQPKKTHRPRKAKRATEISQYSGPIPLVADETVTKER